MSIDTMTWNELAEFENKHIIIFGTDKDGTALMECIKSKYPSITVDFFLKLPSNTHTHTTFGPACADCRTGQSARTAGGSAYSYRA